MKPFIKKNLTMVLLVLLTISVYVWFVSAGTWTTWNSPTRYYANLARGFAKGNLHLPEKPPKELQALPDPYDYKARAQAGVAPPIDVSYYNGKYYLYWGPVPAVALAVVSRVYPRRVGDMQVAFFALCSVFLMQSAFLSAAWRKFFPDLPTWTLWLVVPAAGLTHPNLFVLEHNTGARIYEASILSAQFFLIGGFLAAFSLILGEARLWKAALAGTLWALAIGSRQAIAPAVAWMTLTLTAYLLSAQRERADKLKCVAALVFPLALGVAALGWYNWARFGSIAETGLYYQMNHGFVHYHTDKLFGAQYVLQNLYNYLLMPFRFAAEFPYLFPQLGSRELTALFPNRPSIYGSQVVTGLLISAPFILLAPIPLISLLFPKGRARMNAAQRWAAATLGGAALASFGFLLVFFWAAMRYAEDFMPALVLLSALGFWQGYSLLSKKKIARRLYALAGVALILISIAVSWLLGLAVNEARFMFF